MHDKIVINAMLLITLFATLNYFHVLTFPTTAATIILCASILGIET